MTLKQIAEEYINNLVIYDHNAYLLAKGFIDIFEISDFYVRAFELSHKRGPLIGHYMDSKIIEKDRKVLDTMNTRNV